MNPEEKQLSAVDLANDLFKAALKGNNGDARLASKQILRFLTEMLVFAISASSGGDEDMRVGLQREIGEALASAPIHPACAPQ